MTPLKRAALFVVAPLVCLAVFWRVPFIWFRVDDFAWLSLYQHAHNGSEIFQALFQPAAQGTVRVISERLYFLVLGELFGITSWPYRVMAFGTWFLVLALIQLVGSRLTGSRAAGFWAALLWTVSLTIVTPLMWASAYNQVLIALLILFGFYARLRWIEGGETKWLWLEAIAFLLGFGVLEIIVVYPAIVVAYMMLRSQDQVKRWRTVAWMFVPAALFALSHLVLIPKNPSPIYALKVDSRLPGNLWNYLLWTVGPSRMALRNDERQFQGLLATWTIALAMFGFVAVRVTKGDRRPLFLIAWFLLLMAPVLPLPNHVTDYYVTVPGIGLAWLAGWGLVEAWRTNVATRAVAIALAAIYIAGSVAEVDAVTAWYLNLTSHIRILVRAVQTEAAAHPGSAILVTGLDEDVFFNTFTSRAFELVGADHVWLIPGEDKWTTDTRFGDLSRYRTSVDRLVDLRRKNQLRLVDVSGAPRSEEVSEEYLAELDALVKDSSLVDVGEPGDAGSLGDGWYAIENGARWSAQRARVSIPLPAKEDRTKLRVKGYAGGAALASGPMTIRFKIEGHDVGSETVKMPNSAFEINLTLPPGLVSTSTSGHVVVDLECSRTFRPSGDPRDLGLVFRTFELLP